jgi:hypothetical protein
LSFDFSGLSTMSPAGDAVSDEKALCSDYLIKLVARVRRIANRKSCEKQYSGGLRIRK